MLRDAATAASAGDHFQAKTMQASVRSTLVWKYAAYLAGLVCSLLLISGAVSGFFAYRGSMAALLEVQQATVHYTAKEIGNFMRGVQEALHISVRKFDASAAASIADLRIELVALLRHHREINELRWIDPSGKELLMLSRFDLNAERSGRDWSDDPRYIGARDALDHVGQVYFRKGTEPSVSVAAAQAAGGSVLEADVNLKFVWDLVAQAPLQPGGVAYVIDRDGQLISHSDIGLVLAKTSLSTLPQVQRARDADAKGASMPGEARDLRGTPVVSTAAHIPGLGWTVFAEQPLQQALRPVYASMVRSVALVLLGVVAAVATSVLLARRLVRPIRDIELRARQLGDGQFDQRIALHTGDELEALATQFNRMAGRLQETHATQEARIAERTRDLAIANEAKTRFLAAASHDLRQPIQALALFVGQLRAIELSKDGSALAERIERSVEAIQSLLEALLDLSKLDVGAVHAAPEAFALQDLLARMAAQFAPGAEAKGLTLTLVRTSLWVRTDPLLLERILLNVISNALNYTERGRILIGCRRRGTNAEILVADTGIGIEPRQLPHVFEEFYRAASDHRGAESGLGIGLAIVKRLAALLDHRVGITSVPGKGTVVRILVPRAPAQEHTGAPRLSIIDNLRDKRILIVDDELSVREAMQGLLLRWGCEVDTAGCGDEAIDCARKRRPDVVLCDLNLGDAESGVEVVQRLRRTCETGLACAFVTGESSPERIADARATGHPIAFKPIAPAKLRAILEHLLACG